MLANGTLSTRMLECICCSFSNELFSLPLSAPQSHSTVQTRLKPRCMRFGNFTLYWNNDWVCRYVAVRTLKDTLFHLLLPSEQAFCQTYNIHLYLNTVRLMTYFLIVPFLLNRPPLHGPTSSPILIIWYCILLCFVHLCLNQLKWQGNWVWWQRKLLYICHRNAEEHQ